MFTDSLQSILKVAFLALVGTAVGLSETGCIQVCPTSGCGDQLDIWLEGDATWSEGNFRLTVRTPTGTTMCVPDETSSGGAGGEHNRESKRLTCVGDAAVAVYATQISTHSTPAWVQIELEVDGVVVMEEAIKPSYERVYPAGKACETMCDVAEETVEIPFK